MEHAPGSSLQTTLPTLEAPAGHARSLSSFLEKQQRQRTAEPILLIPTLLRASMKLAGGKHFVKKSPL